MRHVVKRKGHKEEYDEKKVYASAYAACLNCHYGEEAAEQIAETATMYLNKWVEDRREVKASEIREEVKKTLREFDEDLAMMYDSIMDIC